MRAVRETTGGLRSHSCGAMGARGVFDVTDVIGYSCFVVPKYMLAIPFFAVCKSLVGEGTRRKDGVVFLNTDKGFCARCRIGFISRCLEGLRPCTVVAHSDLTCGCCTGFAGGDCGKVSGIFFIGLLGLPRVSASLAPCMMLGVRRPGRCEVGRRLGGVFGRGGVICSCRGPFPCAGIDGLMGGKIVMSSGPVSCLLLCQGTSRICSSEMRTYVPALTFKGGTELFDGDPEVTLFRGTGVPSMERELIDVRKLGRVRSGRVTFLTSLLRWWER